MLNFSIGFSAPSFWMGGGLESRCVGRVYGADGVVAPSTNSVQKTICCNSTSNAPDDGCMRSNMYSYEYFNKITLLHQVVISHYFMRKMHGQTTLMFIPSILIQFIYFH